MRKDANELSEILRSSDTWVIDACAELCELAGLEKEWAAADDRTFESVIFRAADILNVEVL